MLGGVPRPKMQVVNFFSSCYEALKL
ncbi:unnamed protein product [Linum tenue]|uniref:Uncharacterized protein n=1 Tax=Linum tenue TaxID=586396 RepID=A0AAV0ISG3_9ROSI|nr:unnamed protein product [Linum tenue]